MNQQSYAKDYHGLSFSPTQSIQCQLILVYWIAWLQKNTVLAYFGQWSKILSIHTGCESDILSSIHYATLSHSLSPPSHGGISEPEHKWPTWQWYIMSPSTLIRIKNQAQKFLLNVLEIHNMDIFGSVLMDIFVIIQFLVSLWEISANCKICIL